jgi:hypothetical protein
MEEMCGYDSALVVGVLGSSAGATFDAFSLVCEAKRHGARAALFGRKINAPRTSSPLFASCGW